MQGVPLGAVLFDNNIASGAYLSFLILWQWVALFTSRCGLCLKFKALLLFLCALTWVLLAADAVRLSHVSVHLTEQTLLYAVYCVMSVLCFSAANVIRIYNENHTGD